MSNSLLFSVRLHEGWYHGSDTSPSPARLFQALVAGRGLSGPLEDSEIGALRFLEQLPAPTVAAPTSKAGQAIATYVPNNDLDSKRGDHRRIGEIRAQKRIAPRLFNPDVPFLFSWELPDDAEDAKVEQLIGLADGIFQLGRTVDTAWGWAEVVSEDELQDRLRNYYGPVRHPGRGAGSVECPTAGSLDSLSQRYGDMSRRFGLTEDGKGQTFRRPSKPKWQRVSYDTSTTILHFDLVDMATDRHFAWPQNRPAQLVEQIRDAAVAKLKQGLPNREADISSTLIGRRPDGSNNAPTSARVRIVPLPSIGFEHADRRIRRVVVEIPGSCVLRADDIAWAFSGAAFSANTSRLTLVRSAQNPQAKHYGIESSDSGSTAWQTTTPLVLNAATRRRIEPASSEQTGEGAKGTIERDAELSKAHSALRNSLRQAGITAPVASAVLQKEPFDSRGQRVEEFAEQTRFSNHSLWHASIEFDRSVVGPVLVGDGRFLGLGLMNTRPAAAEISGIFAFEIVDGLAQSADPVRICAAVRRAVMSRVREVAGTPRLHSYFTGHRDDGAAADSAKDPHLFFACDLRSNRILILSPKVADRRLTDVWKESGHLKMLRTALRDLQVVRAGIDGVLKLTLTAIDSSADSLFSVSRSWHSATPYTVNRHGRKQTAEAIIKRDVQQECLRRGFPSPEVEVLSWTAVGGAGLQAIMNLHFPRAIRGPVLIGRTRHKGGGLFLSVDVAAGRS